MSDNDEDIHPIPQSATLPGFTVDDSRLDFAPALAPPAAPEPFLTLESAAPEFAAGGIAGALVTGALAATSALYQSVVVNNGGMTFNLEFTLADAPTLAFENEIAAAADLLSAAIPDKITANLVIGYGEVDGMALTNGEAEAGPSYGLSESYASVASALKSHANPGDTNFSSLPSGSSLQGHSSVDVWGAQLKALGYVSATSAQDDGTAGFATDISSSQIVGVALHELTHALGRTPDSNLDIMEMFRFSSPGVNLIQGVTNGTNAAPSYFSVNGGVSKLADYGQNSDPGDFANPDIGTPLSTLSPNDPFDQYYSASTDQYLTSLDLTQLDVLGFNTFAVCYCRGSRILTERGAVAVEALAVGDLVVTARGELRPVAWIGHRELDVARHPFPLEVMPVRVRAGAFGSGLPFRDLWLSPQHGVFVDGVLIPIIRLANGASVAQTRVERVSYWHVELESHDVLLAEGLPAESFLDCGSRSGFANAAGGVALHPTFRPLSWDDACAPLRESGAEVETVRRRLRAQAKALGFHPTLDPGVHIWADGAIVRPQKRSGEGLDFDLPASAHVLKLASRTWRPADKGESEDKRHLGVAVRELEVDGEIQGLGALGAGWHPLEPESGGRWRWTDGLAALPRGARRVSLRLCGEPLYWIERDAREEAA